MMAPKNDDNILPVSHMTSADPRRKHGARVKIACHIGSGGDPYPLRREAEVYESFDSSLMCRIPGDQRSWQVTHIYR